MSKTAFRNFGRNLSFAPRSAYEPRTEEELLDILRRHSGSRLRAVGSLHSWSPAAVTDGVVVDLRHLNHVTALPGADGQESLVRVGAGCTVDRLLSEMRRQANLTLPSLGLITAQTVAGATATGTHGSGKHSMSHYVRAARVAVYDASGTPEVRVVESGIELEAIRCSLGCLGIITELTLEARAQYRVREVFRVHETIETVLAAEYDFPIQQFYLVPWTWRFYAQHRVETAERRSLSSPLYRRYWIKVLDLGLHLVVRLLAQTLRSSRGMKAFFKHVAGRLVVRGWSVVDRSDRQLTMNHDWFRHIEIELFVTQPQLRPALDFLEDALRFFAGEPCNSETVQALDDRGPPAGQYTHHYPICIRKVLPDATLLSMASDVEHPRYAISLISYASVGDREAFLKAARALAHAMGHLFQARVHWGKVCPSNSTEVRRLYPRLDEFLEVRRRLDPENRFGNAWTDELFGQHV